MGRAHIFSDEVYGFVKSFATKGLLLPRSTLEMFAEAKDTEDLISRLKGTIYNEAVSRVSAPFSAERLELSFREHLAEVHNTLMNVNPKPNLLFTYFLKHITWDLKTVLKARALNKSYDEIVLRVNTFAEELVGRRDLIVKALSANDLDEAVRMLKTSEFGPEVESAVRTFKEKNDVLIFDTYLDHAFYKMIVDDFQKMRGTESIKRWSTSEAERCRDMIAIDVDSYNVLSILRAKLWGLGLNQTEEIVIEPGFNLPKGVLESMISSESVGEAAGQLSGTRYRSILPDSEVVDAEGIGKLEDAFEVLGYRAAAYPFTYQIFGTGVALGVVKLKELEVRNLTAIAFGLEQKIGKQAIVSKIISAE